MGIDTPNRFFDSGGAIARRAPSCGARAHAPLPLVLMPSAGSRSVRGVWGVNQAFKCRPPVMIVSNLDAYSFIGPRLASPGQRAAAAVNYSRCAVINAARGSRQCADSRVSLPVELVHRRLRRCRSAGRLPVKDTPNRRQGKCSSAQHRLQVLAPADRQYPSSECQDRNAPPQLPIIFIWSPAD